MARWWFSATWVSIEAEHLVGDDDVVDARVAHEIGVLRIRDLADDGDVGVVDPGDVAQVQQRQVVLALQRAWDSTWSS